MEIIYASWPWYIAGPLLTLVMFLLLYLGGSFGVSANLRTMCTLAGGGRYADFFAINSHKHIWNLVFVIGAILGGFLAGTFLSEGTEITLGSHTIEALKELGLESPGKAYLPEELFGYSALSSIRGISLLLFGGFLIGFGARYAGGCTSGHAISGLSDLQLPSLIAVIGFFIGGLLMTHFILPFIL